MKEVKAALDKFVDKILAYSPDKKKKKVKKVDSDKKGK